MRRKLNCDLICQASNERTLHKEQVTLTEGTIIEFESIDMQNDMVYFEKDNMLYCLKASLLLQCSTEVIDSGSCIQNS